MTTFCDICETDIAEWLVHREHMLPYSEEEPESSVLCDACWQEYIKHPMVTQWSAQSGVSVVTSTLIANIPEGFLEHVYEAD